MPFMLANEYVQLYFYTQWPGPSAKKLLNQVCRRYMSAALLAPASAGSRPTPVCLKAASPTNHFRSKYSLRGVRSADRYHGTRDQAIVDRIVKRRDFRSSVERLRVHISTHHHH